MSTLNGSASAILNSQFLRFTPFEGGEVGGKFEGEKNAVYAQVAPLMALGYSVDYQTDQSIFATLVFRAAFSSTGGGPPPNPNADYKDTWELLRNSSHKELLESDHPYVSALNETNIGELKKYFANPNLAKDGAVFEVGGPNPSPSITSPEAATYLWSLFASGVKTVEVKQPVLRLTRTSSPEYDAPFNVSNVDAVLTTATMILDSGVPANFVVHLSTLASRLIARSGGLIQQARADGIDLRFGWLKDLVGVQKHGRQRMQHTLEYRFGLYDAATYGVPS